MDAGNHLKKYLTRSYLEQLRNIAIAAAGFSAGLLIFLAQTDGNPPYSDTALWSAIFALLVSLYGWQYVLPFILFGEKTFEKFNIYVVALIQMSTVLALLISISAILSHVSVCASTFLVFLGAALATLVIHHNWKIISFSHEKDA